MIYTRDIALNEARLKHKAAVRGRTAATVAAVACIANFLIRMFVMAPLDSALLPAMKKLVSAFTANTQAQAEIPEQLAAAVEYIFMFVVPFGAAYCVYVLLHGRNPENAAKHPSPKLPALFAAGCIGVCYALNAVINIAFGGLFEPFRTPEETLPVTAAGTVIYFIQIALLPAIFEEWAFRGVLLKHMLPYGKAGAIVFSSFLFGLLHVNPPQVIFATAFGILLAVCYEYTRSIKFTAVIHFLNNLISVALQYLDSTENPIAALVTALYIYGMMVVGAVALGYFLRHGIKKQKVSFIQPAHVGAKLRFGRYAFHSFVNGATFVLLALFAYILYASYFYSP